jgi:glyoxylase-like metal-dependent hydrolase (beta-lactamase superfamily II)
MTSMRKSLLAAALVSLGLGTAAADTKLTTTVYTASPGGFLVNSTLIAGEKEAILVDSQFTLADAHRLVAMILESKKTLTTVYITHGHPDHYFGLAVIQAAFPKAKLVTLPGAAAEIAKTARAKVAQWGPMYGANLTAKPVLPTGAKLTTLTLEGQIIEIHGPLQGDAPENTYLWIPSTKTVIAGDIVYRGVHVWTAETNAEKRKAWIKTIDEISALGPTTVIAGHKDPKEKDDAASLKATKDYLEAFDAAVASSKTSDEVQQKVKAKYPALQLDVILKLGADAQFPAAPKK